MVLLDDELIARERGRLAAAAMVAENPESRQRVESIYGVDYCKRRYPEAYAPGSVKEWAKRSLKVLANLRFIG